MPNLFQYATSTQSFPRWNSAKSVFMSNFCHCYSGFTVVWIQSATWRNWWMIIVTSLSRGIWQLSQAEKEIVQEYSWTASLDIWVITGETRLACVVLTTRNMKAHFQRLAEIQQTAVTEFELSYCINRNGLFHSYLFDSLEGKEIFHR